MTREYTAAEKAEAVGLALSVGPVKAAATLQIPRTTIQRWTGSPGMAPIVALNRAELVDRLGQAVTLALERVIEGLNDPASRLSDRARSLEVLSDKWALLSGGATSRTSVMDGGAEPWVPRLGWTELNDIGNWLQERLEAGAPTEEIMGELRLRPGEDPPADSAEEPPDGLG